MEAIKKRYPIRDENGNPSTYPTFASQVFFEDGSVLENKEFGGALYTNLADNSDFTKWVAQAGIGENHGTQAYGGDRWMLTNGSITGEENADGNGYSGITLNGTLTQVVPSPPAVATPFIEMVSSTAEISYDAENGEIVITSSGGVIKNVLLLEGEWTEKPGFVSKGYGAELAECQRYFRILEDGTVLNGCVTGGRKSLLCTIPIDEMRNIPTIVMNDTAFVVRTIAGYPSFASYETPGVPATTLIQRVGAVSYFEMIWDSDIVSTNNTPASMQIIEGSIYLTADL